MKRIVSLILTTVMLFTMGTYKISAYNIEEKDCATYVDSLSGDIMTIEAISTATNMRSSSEDIYQTCILRNGQYEETITIDLKKDTILHEYSNGSIKEDSLSDIVTIRDVDVNRSEDSVTYQLEEELVPLSTDYVGSETFELNSAGMQKELPGASFFDTYCAMGSRGGYYYAPTVYGFLQRKNMGIEEVNFSRRFDFDEGTTIGTAASIIKAFIENQGLMILLEVALALLDPAQSVVDAWSVEFEKRTYKWNYRVRLNSNMGEIIYTTYRTRDYWKSYNIATGVPIYEYAGSRYDDGFLLANTELIKAAIDSYLQGQ